MTTWDESFDLVIVGSGGGGLTAALSAAQAGLRPVVLEKQQYVGGSTAMSGGIVWIPNNPLMRPAGIPDSYEKGMDYLESVVGDAGPGSSRERRDAFLTTGPLMISFLQRMGMKLIRCPGWSDYYDTRKGGNAAGRSVEGIPWDSHQLGDWHDKINPGAAKAVGLVFKTNEARCLSVFTRSVHSFTVATRVFFRTYLSRLRGQDLLTNGMSLVGQLTKIVLDNGIPLWLNTGFEDLIVEDGHVVGVKANRDGKSIAIRANNGVLLSAGGFERNPDMRRKYSGDQPNEAQWTAGNLGNTGEVLASAMAIGAKTDLMDEAWWVPSLTPELAGTTLTFARQYPRTILVNHAGRRFCNESNSYVEVGKAMYANDAVPAWLIFDDEFRSRYPLTSGMKTIRQLGNAIPGRMPQGWLDDGLIIRARTLTELAEKIGADGDILSATVKEFNLHASKGADPAFGRGQSAYNKCLGDPGGKISPCLEPIDKGPFYATKLFPGDVGTSGGLVADENAQVLAEDGRPIPGLYATGNMTATILGRTYPGAGASIAYSMVFGYIAARHAAQSAHRN